MKIRRIVSATLCLVALCATRPALSGMSEDMATRRARYESMTPEERHAYEHKIVRGKLDTMTGRKKSMPTDMDAMYPSGAQRDAHVRNRMAYNEREQLITDLVNQIPQGFSDFRNGNKKLIDSIVMQLTVLLGWEETDELMKAELVAAALDDEPYFASIMKKAQPEKAQPKKEEPKPKKVEPKKAQHARDLVAEKHETVAEPTDANLAQLRAQAEAEAVEEITRLVTNIENLMPMYMGDASAKITVNDLFKKLRTLIAAEDADLLMAKKLVRANLAAEAAVFGGGVVTAVATIQQAIDALDNAMKAVGSASKADKPKLLQALNPIYTKVLDLLGTEYAEKLIDSLTEKYKTGKQQDAPATEDTQKAFITKINSSLEAYKLTPSKETNDALQLAFKAGANEIGLGKAGLDLMAIAINKGLIKNGVIDKNAPPIIKEYQDKVVPSAKFVLTKAFNDYGLQNETARTAMLGNINETRAFLAHLIGKNDAQKFYEETLNELVKIQSINETEKAKLLDDSGWTTKGVVYNLIGTAGGAAIAYAVFNPEVVTNAVSTLFSFFKSTVQETALKEPNVLADPDHAAASWSIFGGL